MTSGIEGFTSQRPPIVSTSMPAKSVVESTGPMNVGTPQIGVLEPFAKYSHNMQGQLHRNEDDTFCTTSLLFLTIEPFHYSVLISP